MIIKKNDHRIPLPLYEVEEVSVEQALKLLNVRQNNLGDSHATVSWMINRLRRSDEAAEIQHSVERLTNIGGPPGTRG
jgi:hypothetical protein